MTNFARKRKSKYGTTDGRHQRADQWYSPLATVSHWIFQSACAIWVGDWVMDASREQDSL